MASSGGAYLEASGTKLPYVFYVDQLDCRILYRIIAYVYDRLVILEAAKNVESAQFPLATLRCIDRSDFDAAVDGGSIFVDEFYGALRLVSIYTVTWHLDNRTATL